MEGGRTEILLRTRLPSSALAIRRNDRSRNERLRRFGWPGNFRLIVVGRGMYGLGKQSMRILEKDMQLNKALDARSQSSHAEQWRRRKVSEFGIVDFRRCRLVCFGTHWPLSHLLPSRTAVHTRSSQPRSVSLFSRLLYR
jgi:hypothetical protein